MKKLLIFSHEYPPCLGGAGSVAHTLREGICASNEYEVTVLTSSRTPSSSSQKIVSVWQSQRLWPFIYSFWLFLNASKFDVIIANDPAAIFAVGKYLPKRLLSKVICFIHGEEKYLVSSSLPLKIFGFKPAFLRAMQHAKKVVFVSAYIEQLYVDLYGISLPDIKRSVIHSGVSSKQFYPVHEINNTKPLYLTVSRLESLKGFDTMLDSFTLLSKKGHDFNWVIAGDGSYFDTFKKKVSSSLICNNVTLLGKVGRSQLSPLYQKANYYISLSELKESYGLSFLEAAFSGVTPIGYNRCGTKEAFQYIHGGYLIDSYKNPNGIAAELHQIMESSQKENTVTCERTVEQFCLEVADEL